MKKFALLLAGCGQHDGSETHEVILTLLALAQENISWDALAPDLVQTKVINHVNNNVMIGESRSVIIEAARLVRGKIKPLNEANISEYDAIVIPGGVGSVNILCNWLDEQENYSIEPGVEHFLNTAKSLQIPMGFICIAPMMIPKLFPGAYLTIGSDDNLNHQIQALGSTAINCLATDIVVDEKNLLVSTPANMVANSIDEVAIGIKKCIQALARLSAAKSNANPKL